MMFNRNITPDCEYCRFGNILDDKHVICLKRGIIGSDTACRRFQYDPLKRKPEIPVKFSADGFSEDDFVL